MFFLPRPADLIVRSGTSISLSGGRERSNKINRAKSPNEQESEKEGRRRVRMAILILGLSMATLAGLLTAAIFTDTQAVGANTFTTGTVDISVAPASVTVTFANMAPG